MRIVELTNETKNNILSDLLKRSPSQMQKFQASVDEIIEDVVNNGDEALVKLTEKFDGVKLDKNALKVTDSEIKEAYASVSDELISTIKKAAENIKKYHQKQVRQSFITTENGITLGQRITPIEKVGVYVPGGRAPLSSSVLMNIIPAVVAGVEKIVMCTPPGQGGKVTPEILVAADIAGAHEIYKVGGAQAIAALAYGTDSIPKVYKIVGPGNIFVTLAKKTVFGLVGIDSVAGPSEILVLADETANPAYIAADLLSQAEHDPMASSILVTTDKDLANKVSDEVDKLKDRLSRSEIINQSLDNFGYILLASSFEDAIDAVNEIASEHLEIQTKNPFDTMTYIKNAGAIFIGENSCEPLGDYFAGPNHVLPTNGTAKFSSPLSVDEFIKKTSLISYSYEELQKAHEDIIRFAKAESLTAHANAIGVRFGKEILDTD